MSPRIVGSRPMVPIYRLPPAPPQRFVLPQASGAHAEHIHDKQAVLSSSIFNTTPTGTVGAATRIL